MTKSQDPAQSFPLCSAGDSPPPSRGPSPRLRHVPEGAFPASDCKSCSRLFSSFTLGSYDHSGRPRCLCPAGFFLEPPSLITSGAAPLPCSQTGCSSAALPPNTCPSQTHPTQGWGHCGLLLQLQGWNPGISRVACALSPPDSCQRTFVFLPVVSQRPPIPPPPDTHTYTPTLYFLNVCFYTQVGNPSFGRGPKTGANLWRSSVGLRGSRFQAGFLELGPSRGLEWPSQEEGAQGPDPKCPLGFSSVTNQQCDFG